MPRKNLGPISKAVKRLCVQLCELRGSEVEFKSGLNQIINNGASFHAVGMSLQKWSLDICKEDYSRVWRLADEANPEIRKAWERFRDGY